VSPRFDLFISGSPRIPSAWRGGRRDRQRFLIRHPLKHHTQDGSSAEFQLWRPFGGPRTTETKPQTNGSPSTSTRKVCRSGSLET
jgi:hypothetical protein